MKKVQPPILPIAYTALHAAAALDVGPGFFDTHIAPELKAVLRGSKRLFPVKELQRWVDQNCEPPMIDQPGLRGRRRTR